MFGAGTLPTFDSWLDQIALSEQADGWLSACADVGRFLVPSCELVGRLAAVLGGLAGSRPILEVCCGGGELAAALGAAGVPIIATDASPPVASPVAPLAAQDALKEYRPAVVLGAFVPADAGVDEAVLACPSVRHYVVLGARIGGILASPALWQSACWRAKPLEEISRWMLTRHDVWLGDERRGILQHGEAWQFSRVEVSNLNGAFAGDCPNFRGGLSVPHEKTVVCRENGTVPFDLRAMAVSAREQKD